MSVRSLPIFVSVLSAALFVATGCSWAQQPTDGAAKAPTTPEETNTEDDLFGADDPLPQDETPVRAATGAGENDTTADDEGGPDMPEGPAATTAEVAATGEGEIHALKSRIADLETDIEELKNQIAALNSQLADQIDPEQLSRRALGAMAEDPEIRSGLGQMLQGKVRLVNDTGDSQVVYINGTPWTVVTGKSYVFSPVGTVSFLHEGDTEPLFIGIQEWTENEETGQFEVEYRVPEAGRESSETSVLKPLPGQSQ